MLSQFALVRLAKLLTHFAKTPFSMLIIFNGQKKLLLAPRELPFSAIALENMQKLAALGVIIAPPVMGYYSESSSLEEMERFIIGKWYDVLGIPNELFTRWE